MECDLSIHNVITLRNTLLLKKYSLIDPRVPAMGLIIKNWYFSSYLRAKARNLNNPHEGSLCTYGYILMLIYYLINKPNPMLLSLQVINSNSLDDPSNLGWKSSK